MVQSLLFAAMLSFCFLIGCANKKLQHGSKHLKNPIRRSYYPVHACYSPCHLAFGYAHHLLVVYSHKVTQRHCTGKKLVILWNSGSYFLDFACHKHSFEFDSGETSQYLMSLLEIKGNIPRGDKGSFRHTFCVEISQLLAFSNVVSQ